MIRRLVGIAHVADMDSIPVDDVRAACELRALRFGRKLLVEPGAFVSVDVLVQEAQEALHSSRLN